MTSGPAFSHRKLIMRIANMSALAFLLMASGAGAQSGKDPLSGISKVTVLVSFHSTGTAPSSISEIRLRTLLELQLRSAGLRVLSEEEYKNDSNLNPYLYLRASTLETRDKRGTVLGYAYRLDLSARVFGDVPINRAIAPMELWADDTMAVASSEVAPADIERIVRTLTDSFLNAWLKANPKR